MATFLCNKCYYITEAEEAPDRCIVCSAEKTAFTEVNCAKKQYIPVYWAEHLKEKIQKIHDNQIKAGRHSFSFALISDIHYGPNQKHSAALLEKVMDDCAIPYVFNAGDTVSGAGLCPPSTIISELQTYGEVFKNLESRTLMAIGNHDPSYSEMEAPNYYKQSLTKGEVFEYLFRYETKYPDRVMSEDGSYFYADKKDAKVRLIVMNPYDVPCDDVNEDGSAKYNKMFTIGYRQEQLEWFANVALDVPDKDWTVVLCTHTCPSAREFSRNEEVILGLINAYRNGTSYEKETEWDIPEYNVKISADYTSRGGEFAIWVSGHTHADRLSMVEGTLCTSIISDWNHQAAELTFERTTGTTMEHAFDVYTMDMKNHKLYVVRVGAGQDRELDYTPRA